MAWGFVSYIHPLFFEKYTMKFLPHILIAAASLACAAGASAQTAYTKVTGEACPSGQRNVELWEVKKDAKAACAALEQWDIVRLANGASLSGSGYQCGVKENDTRKLGHALCVKAPELPKAVGTFSWSVNDKPNGDTTLAANGTCSNSTSQMKCVWKVSNPQKQEFTLNWNDGKFVDTMILSADGKVIEGKNAGNDKIKGIRK